MGSSFFGIHVATQGLYTARINLDITNHNIANAETPGYSRQYGIQSAMRPLPKHGMGMIGTGSEILKINQYRNLYLDVKFWNNNSHLGEYEVKNFQTSSVENLLNELNETGISKHFSDMFDNLGKLATTPGDPSFRNNFIDKASSFAMVFNDIGEQLREQQREANFSIKTKVDQINYCAERIATLNSQIEAMEFSGMQANDLRDKRANVVDELSKIVNVDVEEFQDINGKKTYSVKLNNYSLVEGTDTNVLEVKPRDFLKNPEDEPGLYDINWKGGPSLNLYSTTLEGELKGYIEMRDGNNGDNFTGTLVADINPASDKMLIEGINRTDLPASGEVRIGTQIIEYKSYQVVGGNIEFTLPGSITVTAGPASIGENVPYKGIPYYAERMNHFIRTIAEQFNNIHDDGVDELGAHGIPLFEYDGYTGTMDYNLMTIDNVRFSPDIIADVSKLLTKLKPIDGESDAVLIKKMLKLRHDNNVFSKGQPENYIQSIIGELGIDKEQAKSFMDGQIDMSNMIQNQRLSVSGVNINEETTNLLKFQQAYNLSAQAIKVFDEIYDVTINRMGA
ncbi:flagellar hook-associated protein FlgK [Vallitalea pronyensis]|uniref:Flagellar hook-associated protein 1 n=1 Tax=Vallitalea pronyensis TaxID=1348613 RepID=A0A8J8MGP0_9FIRM|nr:flagellar hook-associated protein FlgK [Vallitalea pronyensis]QUI21452.1 flagellar hook-associated protein FlgK [Vallitalea pronyensis]